MSSTTGFKVKFVPGGCHGGTNLAESCLHANKKILNLKVAGYVVMGDVYSEAPLLCEQGGRLPLLPVLFLLLLLLLKAVI